MKKQDKLTHDVAKYTTNILFIMETIKETYFDSFTKDLKWEFTLLEEQIEGLKKTLTQYQSGNRK